MPELALGHEDRALDGVKLADQLMPDEAAPAVHVHLAYGYARLGQPDSAERVINKGAWNTRH